MRAVLEAMGSLKINLGDQANRAHVKSVLGYTEANAQGGLSPELGAAIKSLWQDAGVQVRP
jgi:guanine nucleotide-binding protein G(i) subunit alpha